VTDVPGWHCWAVRRVASSLRHLFHSREGAALAQVALQFFARSNRRAGYMTCGPRPPCWMRRSRKGAPPWCSCMLPAWRSALSPAGLGEDRGVLVTAGRLHAPREWRFGFFCPGAARMTRGAQPPCHRGRTLKRVGEDLVRDGLRTRAGRIAFKKGSTSWVEAMPSHFPHASHPSAFRAPGWGASALSASCCGRSATLWRLVPFSHRSASRIFVR
jgi:hypothetical protein